MRQNRRTLNNLLRIFRGYFTDGYNPSTTRVHQTLDAHAGRGHSFLISHHPFTPYGDLRNGHHASLVTPLCSSDARALRRAAECRKLFTTLNKVSSPE